MPNSKVPVHDGTDVAPPGAPHKPPCGCAKPGTAVIEIVEGGGGGGTDDYEMLVNKPSIEGVELVGDKSFPELGIFIQPDEEYPQSDDYALTNVEITAIWNAAS